MFSQKKYPFVLLFFAFLSFSCNKGISPLEGIEKPSSLFQFPVTVHGGDPTGSWVPAPGGNALEFRLADPSQIQGLVDTLMLKTSFLGRLMIQPDTTFVLQAVMRVKPVPVVGGVTLDISEIGDTLMEVGRYERPAPGVLILHYPVKTFHLDTLGFTAGDDSLMLVTKTATFPYPGFETIQYYIVMHLRRSSGAPAPAVLNTAPFGELLWRGHPEPPRRFGRATGRGE